MIENTNQFIYLVSITACILMGITFFSFPTPKVAMLQHYKLSKKILGLSYLTLGGLMLFNVLIGSPHKPEQFLAFPSIIISSSQAYLFTFTLLILINPGLGTRRYMWRQLCPILAIITLFIVCNMIWGNPDTHSIKAFVTQIYHPAVAVRFLFFLFYIFQLVYYTYLFRREKRKFIGKMYDYYSDDTVLRLRWVEYAFYAALGIGILAFFSYFFPSILFDNIFVAFYTIFYILFAFGYLRYELFYKMVEKAIEPFVPVASSETTVKEEAETKQSMELPSILKENFLSLMENEKPYLHKGITSDDVATMLHTNRTYLSAMVNHSYGVNFNTYVNRMRVEYACGLMSRQPGLSTAEIAEQVGFADATHFCRQFKTIKGCTTKVWKSQL